MKRALLNLRQLSSLGYASRLTIPRMLRCLYDVVHADFNVYWWANPQGEIVDHYTDDPNTIRHAATYVTDFANDVQPKTWLTARQILQCNTVDNNVHRIVPARYKTEIYQRLMHPCRMHYVVQIPIRNRGGDGGVILLSRSEKGRPFTKHDERRLSLLAPHFAHAMAFREQAWSDTERDSDDDIGLAILDETGRIVHANSIALQLIYLSSREEADQDMFKRRLKQMVEAEATVARGVNACLPAFDIANRWGYFVFRAYRLNSAMGDEDRLVALQVQQYVPIRLKMLSRIQMLGLPQRLAEYCLNLASGMSHIEVAKSMGISSNTAKGYFSVLCDKLDVKGGKQELMHAIMSNSSTVSEH